MLNNLTRAFKNSLIYAIGNISRKAIAFLLLPLYVKHLTISDYGVLGILEVSSQAIIALFGLGLYMALNRWYWDEQHKFKQKEIVFSVSVFLVGTSILAFAGFLPIANSFSNLVFSNGDYTYILKLVFLVSLLEIIAQIFFSVMRLEEKSILFSTTNVIRLIVTLLVTIYLIIFKNRGIAGIYEAQLIGLILYFLMISKFIFAHIVFRFQWSILQEMLQYSFPLILSSISGIFLTLTDRYVLNFMSNLDQVAIYNLAAKLAYVIMVFVVTPIRMSLTPIVYKMVDEPGCKRFYSKILTYFSFVILICVMFMSFFGKEIIIFFTGSNTGYWHATNLVPIIALVIFMGMMKDTVSLGINIVKKTKTISIIMMIVAIFNVGANILLVPYLEAAGAAVATLVSQILLFVLIYHYAQKYYRIPYEMGKVFKMILVAGLLYGIASLITFDSIFLLIGFKLLLILCFPFLLYFWKFYEDIELTTIKRILLKNKF
jgi:O-antigen/teichoic acid export membrane protein